MKWHFNKSYAAETTDSFFISFKTEKSLSQFAKY